MKQLLPVFCISALLTLAACSTEKKEESMQMPTEPMGTQMADGGETTGMENLEEPEDSDLK
jgi:hypothetical protein